MTRTILITSIIVLLAAAGCQASGYQAGENAPKMEWAEGVGQTPMDLDTISTEFDIPPVLPATISDPLLMEGWIALYNQQDAVELWDGYTISGRELAEYVIENKVVITWNTNPSYSGSWVDRSGTGTVYITPEIKDQAEGQVTGLVELMAHELFHRTAPFGKIKVTLYEEYWAFYAGAYVAEVGEAAFYYTHPSETGSLENWFKDHRRSGYVTRLDPYPASMVGLDGE